jgi:Tol biopolymer transport system component
MSAQGGKSLPLVLTPLDHNECPAWSPDGKRLAFASGRTGYGDIYVMAVDVDEVKAELKSLNQ